MFYLKRLVFGLDVELNGVQHILGAEDSVEFLFGDDVVFTNEILYAATCFECLFGNLG